MISVKNRLYVTAEYEMDKETVKKHFIVGPDAKKKKKKFKQAPFQPPRNLSDTVSSIQKKNVEKKKLLDSELNLAIKRRVDKFTSNDYDFESTMAEVADLLSNYCTATDREDEIYTEFPPDAYDEYSPPTSGDENEKTEPRLYLKKTKKEKKEKKPVSVDSDTDDPDHPKEPIVY